MINIPKNVISRLTKEIPGFQKVILGAKDRDVNESDTVTIITDMLSRVFGYDKYVEVTSEQAIKGTFCDLAIKMNGNIKFIIEVKAVGLNLKENHLQQALNYGSNQGIQWVVLTNGEFWEIHKIKFERPIGSDLICSFNFLELNNKRKDDHQSLFLLCKEGLNKGAIETFHEHIKNVNRFTISAIIQSDPVLNLIKRELRKFYSGVKVSTEEIDRILLNEVLKREVIEGDELKNVLKKLKKSNSMIKRKKTIKNANINDKEISENSGLNDSDENL